jgi:threonine/homoserine/homoserine lactone efflux protein
MQWRLALLNLAAVLINVVTWYQGGSWFNLINLACAAFSCWVTWTCIRRARELKQERHDEINQILRSDFG